MPRIRVNGADLYYEDTGGDAKETIVFSHGLLFNCHMFEAQVQALKDNYRCISYDHRGQAQSGVTEDGYDLDTLTKDVYELIKALGVTSCHFVGLSMGGMVGMRLAVHHPELLKSLILLETSADPEPPENIPRYRRLNFVARWFGLRIVARPVMQILFGQKFLNDPARANQREKWKQQITSHNRIGITRAVTGVIERKPVYTELPKIKTPTLIIVGDQDVATVPAKSERIHAQIPNSQFTIIAGAGHSSSIEEPEAVNEAIIAFLNAQNS